MDSRQHNQGGSWGIYRQALDKDTAEPIVSALQDHPGIHNVVSPDGAYLLFLVQSKPGDPKSGANFFRVSMSGGPPAIDRVSGPRRNSVRQVAL
jgi:hypothetical protein